METVSLGSGAGTVLLRLEGMRGHWPNEYGKQ